MGIASVAVIKGQVLFIAVRDGNQSVYENRRSYYRNAAHEQHYLLPGKITG
jgi:hypothetical protein